MVLCVHGFACAWLIGGMRFGVSGLLLLLVMNLLLAIQVHGL